MESGTEALRQVPYFEALDDATLARLLAEARPRRCAAGELILLEGEPCAGLCVVLQGRVRVYKSSDQGREQVLRILGPGRTCNDVAAFDGGPNPGNVAAEEPSLVALLPRGALLALLDAHPEVCRAAVAVLSGRLRALTVLVEDVALRSVVARVAKLLLDCSRGQNPVVEGVEQACATLTQQELASMTGSVRDVVQRALKTLERDGAVRVERAHVRVLDPAALARWGKVDHPDSM